MFSLCSKHNRKVMWNQREKEEINWRAEERRLHGSTFCSFLHVPAFHDHALWNALKTWEPLLCVIQFQARPLPSAHTDKTAWDGKSTWINIYYGRCCFRQVLFRGNLLWIHRCYCNNLLIEVFSLVQWTGPCWLYCEDTVHYGGLSYLTKEFEFFLLYIQIKMINPVINWRYCIYTYWLWPKPNNLTITAWLPLSDNIKTISLSYTGQAQCIPLYINSEWEDHL